MGIIATLKIIAPLTFYCSGIIGALLALIGKVRWALMVILVLCPMRNVVEKLHDMPMGSQFLDLLFLSSIIGWILSSASSSRPLMSKNYINVPAACLIVYLFFSLMLGNHQLTGSFAVDRFSSRVQEWKNFTLLPILFFLMVNNLNDKRWVMRAFLIMLCTMVLMNYYIFFQVTMYSAIESRAKITGTFQFLGPNEVAAFLNQNTVIFSGIFLCLRKHWLKLPLLGMILINTFCIVFIYSRGAYAGLLLGMMVLFSMKKRILLIPSILVLVFWQAVLPEKAIERIKETTNEYGELDRSSEMRIVMWEHSMELFKSNPLVGIGYGVFRYMDFGTDLRDTHNIYAKILSEQGIIGLILFLVVVFSFCRQGIFLYQKGDDDLARGLGLGFFASIFTLLVNNFFGDRWAYFELSSYTWAFAALVVRFSQFIGDSPKGSKMKVVTEAIASDKPAVAVKRTRKSYYK